MRLVGTPSLPSTSTPSHTPQVLGEASPRGWRQKRRKHGLVMSSARTQQTSSSAIVCPRLKQPTQAQTQSQVRPADTQPTTRTLLNSNSGPRFPHPDYPDPSPGPGEPRTPPSKRQTRAPTSWSNPCIPACSSAWAVRHKPSHSSTEAQPELNTIRNCTLLQAMAISRVRVHR